MNELRVRFIRRVIAGAIVGAAGLLAAAEPAIADEGFFIGDSIAAGAASAIGIKGIGRPSISLRRTSIAPQFARIPNGAVGIMSLGVNDAADPVEALRKDIEKVIEAAQKSGRRIVWIGPPCVLRNWDGQAKLLDDYLQQRLAATRIQYVSLRDPQICQPAMRTKDGAHFTIEGYRYVWQKIQRDSTFAALVEAPQKPATSPDIATGALKPAERTAATEAASDAPKSASPSIEGPPDPANQPARQAKGAKETIARSKRASKSPPGRQAQPRSKGAPKWSFRFNGQTPP